jgi:CMP/dCMP kinase
MGNAAGRPLVVAIDGPAGVGKSTAARALAAQLGLPFLDTGAMYRAMALWALETGVHPEDPEQVATLAATAPVGLAPGEDGAAVVILDGNAPGEALRRQEVGELASRLATRPEIRRRLVALQRDFGSRYGAVLEGRDVGTVVFPDTPHKFFLDARPEVRLGRRADQLRAAGREVDEKTLAEAMRARDARDRERSESPLRADETYVVIDTSDLDAAGVVALMARHVRSRATGQGA